MREQKIDDMKKPNFKAFSKIFKNNNNNDEKFSEKKEAKYGIIIYFC